MKHTVEEIRKIAAGFLLRVEFRKTASEDTVQGLERASVPGLPAPASGAVSIDHEQSGQPHQLPAPPRFLAKVMRTFQGTVLLISHDSHFVKDTAVDSIIDMGEKLSSLKQSVA